MNYPWWVYVLLFGVLAGAVAGGWWLYRRVRPEGTEDVYIVRGAVADPLEAVEGFTRRWAALQSDFMRRVAMALVVLAALIAAALGINVTLYAAQKDSGRQQALQVQTNADFLHRLNMELKDRRERAARTDRQQCEDIERLKRNAREAGREGRRTIALLTGLSAADKASLVRSSLATERRFAPRRVTLPDGRVLSGLDACGVLPNAEGP